MGQFGIGQAPRRIEDQRLLLGGGRYSDDISLPGQAVAELVRSPYAHAEISGIDLTEARAAPGVLGADDMPALEITLIENFPCATNPHGIKGAGKAGATGAPPAVINAVIDALAPLGVRHLDMPVTPERVWRTIQQAKSSRTETA